MSTERRPKSVKTEAHISQAVACHFGKYAVRELRVGDCIFDVVAYKKTERLFKVVECKKSRRISGIGRGFGQLAAYSATIAKQGNEFIEAYKKRLPFPLRPGRWKEATHGGRIKLVFYVALKDEACKRVELLSAMKKLLPDVGIIRVKPNGGCRNSIKLGGAKDRELAKARPVAIKILSPPK